MLLKINWCGGLSLRVAIQSNLVTTFYLKKEPWKTRFHQIRDPYLGLGAWKQIWGCRVPNNVKSLIWRACKNALHVKKNLVRRKVLIDDVCEHCKQFPEDVIHALWLYPKVSTVCTSNLMWSLCQTKHFPKFLDLVKHVIEENKDSDAFAMIIWTFWFRRNRLRI